MTRNEFDAHAELARRADQARRTGCAEPMPDEDPLAFAKGLAMAIAVTATALIIGAMFT